MYGLTVNRTMSLSGHPSIINKIRYLYFAFSMHYLQGLCGNYGAAGVGVEFDFLQIPRASTNAIPTGLAVGTAAAGIVTMPVNDNFCGGCLGTKFFPLGFEGISYNSVYKLSKANTVNFYRLAIG